MSPCPTGTSADRPSPRAGRGRARSAAATRSPSRLDAARIAIRQPREALELAEREAERLADVADRAARVVRREARDQSRVLTPVLLGDGDDQLLADVAGKVEVDVGDGLELTVEEASE